jgi:hypothetical protein
MLKQALDRMLPKLIIKRLKIKDALCKAMIMLSMNNVLFLKEEINFQIAWALNMSTNHVELHYRRIYLYTLLITITRHCRLDDQVFSSANDPELFLASFLLL